MQYDRAALKNQVKAELRDTRPRAVLVTLVFLVASFVISTLLNAFSSQNPLLAAMEQVNALTDSYQSGGMDEIALAQELLDIMGGVAPAAVGTGFLFSFISAAVNWTLTFGYQGWCLSVIRREDPGFLKLLCAFPQWGWVLLTGLLVSLFTVLWAIFFMLAATAVIVILMIFMKNTALAATLSFVVLIAACWGMLCIILRYVMANYILLDERVDALEAIKRSKAMMRGRKWHYFELEISFSGWLLLLFFAGSIAAGIATFAAMGSFLSGGDIVGTVMELAGGGDMFISILTWILTLPILMWVRGYMTCAEAKFYDQMRRVDVRNGVWETDQDYRAHYMPERERKPVRKREKAASVPLSQSVQRPQPVREPAPAKGPGPAEEAPRQSIQELESIQMDEGPRASTTELEPEFTQRFEPVKEEADLAVKATDDTKEETEHE